MQYFSVLDILMDKAKAKGQSENEVFSTLKATGVRRADLECLRNTAYYPEDPKILKAMLNYLEMDQLTLDLSLGKIPPGYRQAYYDNIGKISKILQAANNHQTELRCLPDVAFRSDLGILYQGDCTKILKNIESNSVDLIFADPPFNLGKEYDEGINDQLHVSSYLNWTFEWVDECVRILRDGGYLFIYNIPKWCIHIASYLNQYLTYWDWIALDMKYSLPIARRLYPAHYALISYVKGSKPRTFNNQRMPLQTCRHCGGEIKDYGGYKGKMNPLGVNISDIWSDIYPVRHKKTKNRKYNELPVKLLDRIIMMATNEGDKVLDPFGGSGTTYAVAELRNRRWLGCELGNCEVIASRLNNLSNDSRQLANIDGQRNHLFTPDVEKLRRKNRFWLCEDVAEKKDGSQISLFSNIDE